jgi:hypothetical protein
MIDEVYEDITIQPLDTPQASNRQQSMLRQAFGDDTFRSSLQPEPMNVSEPMLTIEVDHDKECVKHARNR